MKYLLVISIFLLTSCTKKKEVPSVDHYYDIKVEKLKISYQEECRADAIEAAEKHVDAIIDKWIKEQSTNEVDFPLKPRRPVAPKKIIGDN